MRAGLVAPSRGAVACCTPLVRRPGRVRTTASQDREGSSHARATVVRAKGQAMSEPGRFGGGGGSKLKSRSMPGARWGSTRRINFPGVPVNHLQHTEQTLGLQISKARWTWRQATWCWPTAEGSGARTVRCVPQVHGRGERQGCRFARCVFRGAVWQAGATATTVDASGKESSDGGIEQHHPTASQVRLACSGRREGFLRCDVNGLIARWPTRSGGRACPAAVWALLSAQSTSSSDVRLTPKSGHSPRLMGGRLCAISRRSRAASQYF